MDKLNDTSAECISGTTDSLLTPQNSHSCSSSSARTSPGMTTAEATQMMSTPDLLLEWVTTTQKDNAALQRKLDIMAEENEEYKCKVTSMQNDNEALKRNLDIMAEENEENKCMVTAMENDNAALKRKLDIITEKIDQVWHQSRLPNDLHRTQDTI